MLQEVQPDPSLQAAPSWTGDEAGPGSSDSPGTRSLSKAASRVSWTGWCLLVTCILLETAAQLLFKVGATQAGSGLSNLETVRNAAGSHWAILGYVCMALQFPVWLGVLARMDLSLAFPAGSLSQVTILLGSVFLLSEQVSLIHLIGIALILLGIFMLLGGEEKT